MLEIIGGTIVAGPAVAFVKLIDKPLVSEKERQGLGPAPFHPTGLIEHLGYLLGIGMWVGPIAFFIWILSVMGA